MGKKEKTKKLRFLVVGVRLPNVTFVRIFRKEDRELGDIQKKCENCRKKSATVFTISFTEEYWNFKRLAAFNAWLKCNE